jgi:hypothetical protein
MASASLCASRIRAAGEIALGRGRKHAPPQPGLARSGLWKGRADSARERQAEPDVVARVVRLTPYLIYRRCGGLHVECLARIAAPRNMNLGITLE